MSTIRFINYFVFSALLAILLPDEALKTIDSDAFFTVLFLFASIVPYMIWQMTSRKHELSGNIAEELSRLRRIHHIIETMGSASWRNEMDEALTRYQIILSQDITAYPEANQAYREVSHMVYSYKPKTRREEILLEELLDTTRELALGRQQIQGLLEVRLDPLQWTLMVALSGMVIFSLYFASSGEPYSRIMFGFAALSIFFALELLWRSAIHGRGAIERIQHEYQVNVPSKQEPNNR